MNKLVLLLCLVVGLCKTIDGYCANRCETVAVIVPVAVPSACSNACPTSSCMPYSSSCNTCSLSDCVKTCSSMSSCNCNRCGCDDPECKCLKALTNFPEVEYPMPSCGCSRTYYY